MRVEATKQAASGPSGGKPHDAAAAHEAESRALVVVAPAAALATATIHNQAAFLAHLIAVKEHAPQTRERRRADPAEASAAYRAVQATETSDCKALELLEIVQRYV